MSTISLESVFSCYPANDFEKYFILLMMTFFLAINVSTTFLSESIIFMAIYYCCFSSDSYFFYSTRRFWFFRWREYFELPMLWLSLSTWVDELLVMCLCEASDYSSILIFLPIIWQFSIVLVTWCPEILFVSEIDRVDYEGNPLDAEAASPLALSFDDELGGKGGGWFKADFVVSVKCCCF